MSLHFFPRGSIDPISAVQWDGTNIEQIEAFLGNVEMFFACESQISGRILIGDPDFPFWLERGEWLTRDHEGQLDGWANVHFREAYSLQASEA